MRPLVKNDNLMKACKVKHPINISCLVAISNALRALLSSSKPLSLQVNSNKGYNTPLNVPYLGPNYLYFGFLPISSANAKTTQGLQVNI